MKFLAVAVLCVAFATSNAGIIPGAIIDHGDSAVIQGPSSRTTVHGPDGSLIAADAPGGSVVAAKSAGLIGHSAVVAAAPVLAARVAPVFAHAAPLVHTPLVKSAVVAHHSPLIAPAHLVRGSIGYPLFAPGSGIEGQYVHDFTETLYDDGQYHGEIYH